MSNVIFAKLLLATQMIIQEKDMSNANAIKGYFLDNNLSRLDYMINIYFH